MRYFLFVSYRGTNYHGWQIQKNALSVQEVINNALSTILREKIQTIGSGRTDTGVHAAEQVLHFEINHELDKDDFIYKLNSLLPKDISVSNLRQVKFDAHARFSALERRYVYKITKWKDPFSPDLAYYFRGDLNLEAMNDLSDFLIEWEDFECFSRVKTDVNNFLCSIRDLEWVAENERLYFSISANRFLRGMVRAIIGTLIEVGLGNKTKQNVIDIVHSRDRRNAGSAVPPHGLFLNNIIYPADIFIGNN